MVPVTTGNLIDKLRDLLALYSLAVLLLKQNSRCLVCVCVCECVSVCVCNTEFNSILIPCETSYELEKTL